MKKKHFLLGQLLLLIWYLTSFPSPDTALELEEESVLYVAGGSTDSAGLLIPGYWISGAWTALPSLDAGQNSFVNGMLLVS